MAPGEGAEIEMVSSHVEPESAPDPIAAETKVTTDDDEENQHSRMDEQDNQPEADCGECNFDCHICLDKASDPVVTQCGHLFCWPCLYQWLQHNTPPVCPVCKAGVSEEKLIPIFVASTGPADGGLRRRTATGIPSRPRGQPEPVRQPEGFEEGDQMMPPFDAHIAEQERSTVSFGLFPSIMGVHMQSIREGSLLYNPNSSCSWITKTVYVVCGLLICGMLFA